MNGHARHHGNDGTSCAWIRQGGTCQQLWLILRLF